jgi:hypothetical protein
MTTLAVHNKTVHLNTFLEFVDFRFPERAKKGEDNEDSDFVHFEDEEGEEEEEDEAEKDLMSQEMYDKLILEQRRYQVRYVSIHSSVHSLLVLALRTN